MATGFTGVELISIERERKQARGTRTAEKDAKLDAGELLFAAECYIKAAIATEGDEEDADEACDFAEDYWMFEGSPNFSDDTIENLARAGALIAAEIDRIKAAESVSVKVESPGCLCSTDSQLKSPFSEAELLSLGFVKSVTPASTAFVHECGVIHSRDDGLWSYVGIRMAPFENIDDLSRFIASYKTLDAGGKALNELLKSVVYSEGLLALEK